MRNISEAHFQSCKNQQGADPLLLLPCLFFQADVSFSCNKRDSHRCRSTKNDFYMFFKFFISWKFIKLIISQKIGPLFKPSAWNLSFIDSEMRANASHETTATCDKYFQTGYMNWLVWAAALINSCDYVIDSPVWHLQLKTLVQEVPPRI